MSLGHTPKQSDQTIREHIDNLEKKCGHYCQLAERYSNALTRIANKISTPVHIKRIAQSALEEGKGK